MNYEKLTILKALDGDEGHREESFKALVERGVDGSYFYIEPKMWLFPIQHKKKYGKYPTRKTFEKALGVVDPVDISEPLDFYIDELAKSKRFKLVSMAMVNADRMFEKDDIDGAIAHLRFELKRVDSTLKSQDLVIHKSVDERWDMYEAKMKNPGIDGIPSGLAPMDKATLGWHGGEFILMAATTGSYKCVDENSTVRLVSGEVISLKEFKLRGEKFINSFDERTGKVVVSKVKSVIDTGFKDGFEVETAMGRVSRVSGIHPYLSDNGWEKACDLEIGDRIAIPRRINVEGGVDVDLDKAYFLGLMLAEGSTTKGEAVFSTAEQEILQWARKFAKEHFLKVVKCGKYDYRFSSRVPYKSNFARGLVREFNLVGCKAKDKVIPKEVFMWSREAKAVVIKAMYDGDGSVSQSKKEIIYTTSSAQLAKGLVSLLLEFGIVVRCRKYSNKFGGFWMLVINASESVNFIKEIPKLIHVKSKKLNFVSVNTYVDSVYLPMYLLKKLQQAVDDYGKENFSRDCGVVDFNGLVSRRKLISRGVLKSKVEFLFSKGCIQKDVFSAVMYFVTREVFMDKIVRKESIKAVKMVDLEVIGTHNFIVDDVLVHNTWTLLYFVKAALDAGKKVLIATVEMGKYQIARRLDSILTGTEFEKIRTGQFKDKKDVAEFKKRMDAVKKVNECVVIGGISFGELFLQTKIEEYQPDIVFIDGIYLVQDDAQKKAQWEALQSISAGFKKIADAYNVPIFATTQAWPKSKKPGSKGDETVSDIAFSGAMAQNADIVIHVGRIYDPILEAFTNRMWVKLTKLREGEPVKFKSEIDFTDMKLRETLGIADNRSDLKASDVSPEDGLIEGKDFNVGISGKELDESEQVPF